MIISAKIATLLAWFLILFNLISPLANYAAVINGVGIFLVIAHAIEALVYFPAAKKAGGNLAWHTVQLLIFGYAHNMQLMKINQAAQ